MWRNRRKQKEEKQTAFLLEEMEPRVLFSAGGVDTGSLGANDQFASAANDILLADIQNLQQQNSAASSTPQKVSDNISLLNQPVSKNNLRATFTVDSTSDTVDSNPGDGVALDGTNKTSLRAAIMEANALGGSHTINVPAGVYILSLDGSNEDMGVSGDLDITADISIIGAGSDLTIINAESGVSSGDRAFDVFGDAVSIRGISIRGGEDVIDGGGIRVANGSELNLRNVEILKNDAARGGGIHNSGTLTISDSIIFENGSTTGNQGGGVFNAGGVSIQNSTIDSNRASAIGGGVYQSPVATNNADLINVTVSNNFSASGGGLYGGQNVSILNSTFTNNSSNNGGGIVSVNTITIQNTIVAGNTSTNASVDVSGAFASFGGNLIGDGTNSSGLVHGSNSDQLGTSSSPIDPLLNASLSKNGGDTPTYALLSNSPAINSGVSTNAPVVDQRGVARDSATDIGAFEFSESTDIVSVTTTSDVVDGDTQSIGNLNTSPGADGLISLREAIIAANNTVNGATPDQIVFDIEAAPVNGVHNITIGGTPLPSITDPVTIDGNGANLIRIDGSGTTGNGLTLNSPNNTIRTLAIGGFNGNGLLITSDNNTIESSNIGVNATGDVADPNTGYGILIDNASDNKIGVAGLGNLISGNGAAGISIQGSGSTDNLIHANFIGTDGNGTAALPNAGYGIELDSGTPNANIIGGQTLNVGNLISGNGTGGVRIADGATGNVIAGNFIGTDLTGFFPLENGVTSAGGGVLVEGLANFNVIGGPSIEWGNRIGFNNGNGVRIDGGAVSNSILLNSIFASTAANIDNTSGGNQERAPTQLLSAVENGNEFRIATQYSDPGAPNQLLRIDYYRTPNDLSETLIPYSTATFNTNSSGFANVEHFADSLADPALIGQYITAIVTDAAGNSSEISTQQVITATNIAPALTPGVYDMGLANQNRAVQGILVSDIVADMTVSDEDGDVLGIAIQSASGAGTWQYSTDSTNGTNGAWTSFGTVSETANLLLDDSSWIRYNAQGNAPTTVNLAFRAWDQSSETASSQGSPSTADPDGGGNFSAFSSDIAQTSLEVIGTTLIVNTVSDSSDGNTAGIAELTASPGTDGMISLREAIEATNNTANGSTPDQIDFDIPGSLPVTNPGHTIEISSSQLPSITEAVIIDGTTEPDYANFNRPVVELDGAGGASTNSGLVVQANGVTIRGLVINNFPDHGLEISNASNTIVQSNYFGTDVTGSVLKQIGSDAIEISDGSNNQIGGDGVGNLISGSGLSGIVILGSGASGNLVQGNLIGTSATGDVAIGNAANGIDIRSGAPSFNQIGGTTPQLRNVISGNGGSGIYLGNDTSETEIYGNYIGTGANGSVALGNGANGILLDGDATSNYIGENQFSGSGNIIAHNGSTGVLLNGAFVNQNLIQQNSIHSNGGQAISLLAGSNDNRIAPSINSAVFSTGNLNISGTHADAAIAGDTLLVEYFLNSVSNVEGRTYIGSEEFLAGASPVPFSAQISTAVSSGDYLTATVSDSSGNTSEFSNATPVTVNSAPVALGGIFPIGDTNEGTTTNGILISQVVSFGVASDADGDPIGLAIRGNQGEGVLQYSLNSTNGINGDWTGVPSEPTVASEYLLLDRNTWIRFQAPMSGAQTIRAEVRAWDGTSDAASSFNSPSIVDPGVGGGSSAYSSQAGYLQLNILSTNTPPTADPVSSATMAEGDKLILDGQTSSDSDGNIVRWEWDINYDGSFDSDISGQVISQSWSLLDQYGINTQGDYAIALRVTDDDGASHTVSYQQTVSNKPPTLLVRGSQSVAAGIPYQLSLSATDFGDNTVSAWQVDWGDGSVETYQITSGNVAHTYTDANQKRDIYVSAVDNDGTWHTSDLLIANDGPTANLHRLDGSTAAVVASSGVADRTVGLALGPDGLVYSSDPVTGSIYRYDPHNNIELDEFISGTDSGLQLAAGIAFGPSGDLYVADQRGDTIRKFDGVSGALVASISAGGSSLDGPVYLKIHDDGWLYVTSASNEILRFDPNTGELDGAFVSASNNGGLDTPYQFAFGPDGDLFVSSALNDAVYRYDGVTGLPSGSGQPFISATGNGLNTPTGLAIGPDGYLYVANISDDIVHRYDVNTGALIDQFVDGTALGARAPRHIIFVPDIQLVVQAVPVFGNAENLLGQSDSDDFATITFDNLMSASAVSHEDGVVSHFKVQASQNGTLFLGSSPETASAFETGNNDIITAGINAYWYPSSTSDGNTNVFKANAIDSEGLSSSSSFQAQIDVMAVNLAPSFSPVATDFSVLENTDTEQGLFITNLPIQDDQRGSNDLHLSGPDAEWFNIAEGALYLNEGVTLNFEERQQLQVSVLLDDAAIGEAHEDTIDLQVNINDVNEAPSASATLNNFEENTDSSDGLIAATLTATDPDYDETLSFRIVGGKDADKFSLEDNTRLILQDGLLDYERNPKYEVVVELVDLAGNVFELELSIEVIDQDEITAILIEEAAEELRNEAEAETSSTSSTSTTATAVEETIPEEKEEPSEPEVQTTTEEPEAANSSANEPGSRETLIGRSRGQTHQADEVSEGEGIEVNLGPAKVVELEILNGATAFGDQEARVVIDLDNVLALDSEQLQTVLNTGIGDEFDRFGETTDYSMLDNSSFTGGLDNLRQGLNDTQAVERLVIGSSATVTTGLSIGYVLWLIRGSVLLSTVLSSLPAWRLVDPLPVLGTMLAASNSGEDDESLESIIDDAESNEEPETGDQESKQS
ncbi:MAG: choice-of-anchor Q domain-containing protein [Pseudomonadales bacterium]